MKTPLAIKDATIRKALLKHFGVMVKDLTFIPEGAGAWLYSCYDDTGKKMVVKIQKKPRKLESDIYQGLARAGYKWMPQPILTLQKKRIWAKEGGYHYSMQEFLEPGPNSHIFALDDMYLPGLGKALRDLHDIELPKYIMKRIKHEEYVPENYEQVQKSLAKIQKTRLQKHQVLKKLVQDEIDTIRKFQSLSLAKGRELKSTNKPMALVHGDVHPFNILRPGREVYLTDWEICRIAHPENDLMYFDDRQVQLISEGYGQDLLQNRAAIDYYRMHLRTRELYFFGVELGFEGKNEKQRQYGRVSFKETCAKIKEEYLK
jgi:hypothetical protein